MRFALPVILLLAFFAGCSSETESLRKKAGNSDKAIIYFYDKMTGTPYAVDSILNMDTLQIILAGVSDEDAPALNCGYSGTIEFFANNQPQVKLDFNIEKGCEHFSFTVKDKSYSKKINPEAAGVLGNLYSKSKINQ